MKFNTRQIGWVYSAVLLACASHAQAAEFTGLPTLGGTHSEAFAINKAGQVAGYSYFQPNHTADHAVVWNGTTPTDLGAPAGKSTYAQGINDAGQVVGYSKIIGTATTRAFTWIGGTAIDLGTLGGPSSQANAINKAGQAVGFSQTGGEVWSTHAVLWSGSTITDLGALKGASYSIATAINDRGQIAGYALNSNYRERAVLWDGGKIKELGTLFGGSASSASGINNEGTVVGWSYALFNAGAHATMWSGIKVVDLGTLGGPISQANAINAAGLIVGNSRIDTGSQTSLAAIWYWKGNKKAVNLNTFLTPEEVSAGWVLTTATGINDNGVVVGTAFNTVTNAQYGYKLSLTAAP